MAESSRSRRAIPRKVEVPTGTWPAARATLISHVKPCVGVLWFGTHGGDYNDFIGDRFCAVEDVSTTGNVIHARGNDDAFADHPQRCLIQGSCRSRVLKAGPHHHPVHSSPGDPAAGRAGARNLEAGQAAVQEQDRNHRVAPSQGPAAGGPISSSGSGGAGSSSGSSGAPWARVLPLRRLRPPSCPPSSSSWPTHGTSGPPGSPPRPRPPGPLGSGALLQFSAIEHFGVDDISLATGHGAGRSLH